MKLVGALSTAVLSLTLGIAAPAYAQQEQHDQQEENKDKPAQEKEKKAQPEKPAKAEEKNARQEDKKTKPEENKAQQEKSNKPEEKNAQQEKNSKQEENNAKQEKNSKQEENNAKEQHTQESKPGKQEEQARGNGAGRIPDDRFRANFGKDHRFRVNEADYRRDRRFQYGGYWFGFVDPWPSNWLYTQDVFVVEIDGVYYLCNADYPGVNIALSVTM
jgi:outer membrane biosynthesis protein TonB